MEVRILSVPMIRYTNIVPGVVSY